ncbi:J domain-containing protein [Pontibacter sp. E15-1]|uniref:J domain-containing protein n=1 Tax=Pontibacter sp. E15-1 TaxID=2919918 RepID=UPI001F4FDA85|nr:J domain-containing protein [Pontibacter sp. E15-1]MCJ8165501.1 J domain-containing protein [Pontibacter sp. E15-1]
MSQSHPPALSRTPQIIVPGKSELSTLQHAFNEKTLQIEKLKREIAARKESIAVAQQRFEKELQPVIQQVAAQRAETVKLLDAAYALPFFKRQEKEKLAALIVGISRELIAKHNRPDMLEYHDRYAEIPFAEGLNYTDDYFETQPDEPFESTFAAEAEVADADPFEDYQAQLDREAEQREREKQNRQKNRKTKAQLAKEAQAKAELNNISKASRRVYTELAKQLHPDTEQDETARVWKEEAMKKVTLAYHHDDFFELLRLQMEFLQEQSLHKLPENQLTYYIQILTDQINDLKDELNNFSFGHNAGFYEQFCGSPKQMNQKFKQAKEDLGYELQHLKLNVRTLQDPQEVRNMLKELR